MHSTHNTVSVRGWNPVLVVGVIEKVILHCCDYLQTRCGELPTADQLTTFLSEVVDCLNWYDLESDPKRPVLKMENATFVFDNGISVNTRNDNNPRLVIVGVPLEQVELAQQSGMTVRHAVDVVQLTFIGGEYTIDPPTAAISMPVPGHSLTHEVIGLGV